MSVNNRQAKKVIALSGLLMLVLVNGCSYFQDEEIAFFNTKVEDGVVILGSDPVVDNNFKAQKEVEMVTKDNFIKPIQNQTSRTKANKSTRELVKAKVDSLNMYLLSKFDFSDGVAKKARISKTRLKDLMNLYALGIDRTANSNELAYLSKFVVKAAKGSIKHQEEVADFYLDGFNGETYEPLAISWYLIAANSGSAYSKYMLSILYQLGVGLPQDLSESVAWYKNASDTKENASAKIRIAKRYLSPNSLIYDPKQAFVWMQSAALQGDFEAQYLLADMYLQGKGVDKSEMEAINWYGKAAEQNSAYAQYSLGVMFYNGQGTEQNLLEARKWLEYAAWQGHSEAQHLLSRMYQQGFGVEKSLPKAYAWNSLITNDGLIMEGYTQRISDLIAAMTPEEKSIADKLVGEYKAKVVVG